MKIAIAVVAIAVVAGFSLRHATLPEVQKS